MLTDCGVGRSRVVGSSESFCEVEGLEVKPLCMVLVENKDDEEDGASLVVEVSLKGRGKVGNWSESSLVAFSNCLGMPTLGFEEEILKSLKKMKRRREVKKREYGQGRKSLAASKFKREPKKLENSINYDANISSRGGRGKERQVVESICQ